jgi:hypothetical protein
VEGTGAPGAPDSEVVAGPSDGVGVAGAPDSAPPALGTVGLDTDAVSLSFGAPL